MYSLLLSKSLLIERNLLYRCQNGWTINAIGRQNQLEEGDVEVVDVIQRREDGTGPGSSYIHITTAWL